jgi:predicted nucleotidyltransferase
MAVKGADFTQRRQTLHRHSALELALVFGSVARGAACDGSDLGIAVQAAQPLSASQKIARMGDLALAIGRPVDLIDLRKVGEPLLGHTRNAPSTNGGGLGSGPDATKAGGLAALTGAPWTKTRRTCFRNLAVPNDEAIDWGIVFILAGEPLADFEEFAVAVSERMRMRGGRGVKGET